MFSFPLTPSTPLSAGCPCAGRQSLEGVVALASRLHSAGRLAELGYLLAATAAQVPPRPPPAITLSG